MSTLADPGMQSHCCERIARVGPGAAPKWGRMNAHQMICHLNDSFRVATGERYASPASNFLQRTVVKWIALRTPVKWPQGVPTRPEIDQGAGGGTPPTEWERDCAELRTLIRGFADQKTFAAHPIFGEMSRQDWLTWGYRHVDHHLRQFGV
jgi:hypothetical protein